MGGGERVAIHSMVAALRMGHEVTLLSEEFDAIRFEDFFGCYGLLDKVLKLTYPTFDPLVGSGFLLYQRLYYYQKQFRRLLSRHNGFDLGLGTQDVGYVPTMRAPVIQYCYFPEYFRHLQSQPSSPLWRIYYGPARIYYRNRVRLIDRFLAVSNFTRGVVKEIWGRESITLYPPCPVDDYKSAKEQRENVAITIGRIVPEKRMHLFLEIAKKLPESRFVIIGSVANQEDSYYRSLKKNAPDNLSILLSPLRKAKDILAKAKVYVHCAQDEHFGITIVEAMASGCVPVVHDSGGPMEIVTRDVGYRWRDIDQATQQISKLMKEGTLWDEFSAASSSRAAMFSTQAFESSLEAILADYE